jgi:hypothetical protein
MILGALSQMRAALPDDVAFRVFVVTGDEEAPNGKCVRGVPRKAQRIWDEITLLHFGAHIASKTKKVIRACYQGFLSFGAVLMAPSSTGWTSATMCVVV